MMDGPKALPPFVIDAALGSGAIDLQKWRTWIDIYGPMCAAWLVKHFSKTIKQAGHFKVFVPRLVDLSLQSKRFRWFKLALAYIRKSTRWRVIVRDVWHKDTDRGKEFDFKWMLSRHRRG
jgi:hypothetical protein